MKTLYKFKLFPRNENLVFKTLKVTISLYSNIRDENLDQTKNENFENKIYFKDTFILSFHYFNLLFANLSLIRLTIYFSIC